MFLKDSYGRLQPAFEMTEDGVMQLALKYDAISRYKCIQELKRLKEQQPKLPSNYIEALEAHLQPEKEKAIAIAERDEAIRTKAYISDSKTATALGRNGGLVAANNRLKERLGESKNYATTIFVTQAFNATTEPEWGPLKKYCKDNNLEIKKVSGGAAFKELNAYPAKAWLEVYGIDLNELF